MEYKNVKLSAKKSVIEVQNGEIKNDWQLLLWARTNKMADKKMNEDWN